MPLMKAVQVRAPGAEFELVSREVPRCQAGSWASGSGWDGTEGTVSSAMQRSWSPFRRVEHE
jgi:hypothetical protein